MQLQNNLLILNIYVFHSMIWFVQKPYIYIMNVWERIMEFRRRCCKTLEHKTHYKISFKYKIDRVCKCVVFLAKSHFIFYLWSIVFHTVAKTQLSSYSVKTFILNKMYLFAKWMQFCTFSRWNGFFKRMHKPQKTINRSIRPIDHNKQMNIIHSHTHSLTHTKHNMVLIRHLYSNPHSIEILL